MTFSELRTEIESLSFDANKIIQDPKWESWSGTELLETEKVLKALDRTKKDEERRLSDLSEKLWSAERRLQNWESVDDILATRKAMREVQQALEERL